MKSAIPKVLHPLAGWPMVRHVLENVSRLRPARVVGVVATGAKDVAAAFAPHPTAVQRRPRGTGDATRAALGALKGHRGPVLVVYADAYEWVELPNVHGMSQFADGGLLGSNTLNT